MVEFHSTVLGRRFYEHHVPEIMRSLQSISEELKRANDLKEQDLRAKETKHEEMD